MFVWWPEVNAKCLYVLHLTFEAKHLTEFGVHNSAELAGHSTPGPRRHQPLIFIRNSKAFKVKQ